LDTEISENTGIFIVDVLVGTAFLIYRSNKFNAKKLKENTFHKWKYKLAVGKTR